MKKLALTLVSIAVFAIGITANSFAQTTPIEQKEIAPNLYRLFVNNAVSVVVFDGNDGKVIVDAGYERTAKDLKDAIASISNSPNAYLINTHIHGDHTGGNALFGEDNLTIISHDNVKKYLSIDKIQSDRTIPAAPKAALPSITFTDRLTLDINEQQLELIHLSGGHTNSDIIVYFPISKVLALGDLLFANYFPYVDTGNGGNPLKYIENAEWIIKTFSSDITLIGGHGPTYSIEQYKSWINSLKETMEVAKSHKQKGMTLEEMKETKILKQWESYGSFFITEDRWLDTIYPFI